MFLLTILTLDVGRFPGSLIGFIGYTGVTELHPAERRIVHKLSFIVAPNSIYRQSVCFSCDFS